MFSWDLIYLNIKKRLLKLEKPSEKEKEILRMVNKNYLSINKSEHEKIL